MANQKKSDESPAFYACWAIVTIIGGTLGYWWGVDPDAVLRTIAGAVLAGTIWFVGNKILGWLSGDGDE